MLSAPRFAPLLLVIVASVAAGVGCKSSAPGGGDPRTDAAADAASPADAAIPLDAEVDPSVRGPFPIVLCHGMGGFESIGPLNYFYQVQSHLRAQGHQVFTTQVPMFAGVAARAAALAPQIDSILEETGAAKVNLIGHSQGGLDVRYLVASLGYARKVASVTTIATPHHGTPIADVVVGLVPAPGYGIVDRLVQLFDVVIGQNGELDLQRSLIDMTTYYTESTFNPENPDAPGVAYYSYAGICRVGNDVDERTEDRCDLPLQPMHLYLLDVAGNNDGLVPEQSAQWGTYLGQLPADHLDEVGQIAGIVGPAFSYLDFYSRHAQFLVGQGF